MGRVIKPLVAAGKELHALDSLNHFERGGFCPTCESVREHVNFRFTCPIFSFTRIIYPQSPFRNLKSCTSLKSQS